MRCAIAIVQISMEKYIFIEGRGSLRALTRDLGDPPKNMLSFLSCVRFCFYPKTRFFKIYESLLLSKEPAWVDHGRGL
jgi:hypothetical protein